MRIDPAQIARLITENPDVPAEPNANTNDIKQKVVEWNDVYDELSREIRLKDLSPTAYEALVVSEILDICDGNASLAIQVLEHEDSEGGWMMGDAIGKLATKTKPNDQQVPWLMADMPNDQGGVTYVFFIEEGISLEIHTDANRKYTGYDCANIDDPDVLQPYLDAAGELLESEGKMVS